MIRSFTVVIWGCLLFFEVTLASITNANLINKIFACFFVDREWIIDVAKTGGMTIINFLTEEKVNVVKYTLNHSAVSSLRSRSC